jgi:hypothetical protein
MPRQKLGEFTDTYQAAPNFPGPGGYINNTARDEFLTEKEQEAFNLRDIERIKRETGAMGSVADLKRFEGNRRPSFDERLEIQRETDRRGEDIDTRAFMTDEEKRLEEEAIRKAIERFKANQQGGSWTNYLDDDLGLDVGYPGRNMTVRENLEQERQYNLPSSKARRAADEKDRLRLEEKSRRLEADRAAMHKQSDAIRKNREKYGYTFGGNQLETSRRR